jgi:hypothetical protein
VEIVSPLLCASANWIDRVIVRTINRLSGKCGQTVCFTLFRICRLEFIRSGITVTFAPWPFSISCNSLLKHSAASHLEQSAVPCRRRCRRSGRILIKVGPDAESWYPQCFAVLKNVRGLFRCLIGHIISSNDTGLILSQLCSWDRLSL